MVSRKSRGGRWAWEPAPPDTYRTLPETQEMAQAMAKLREAVTAIRPLPENSVAITGKYDGAIIAAAREIATITPNTVEDIMDRLWRVIAANGCVEVVHTGSDGHIVRRWAFHMEPRT
jgi:hypothetical protein